MDKCKKPKSLHKLKHNYQLTNKDREDLCRYISELQDKEAALCVFSKGLTHSSYVCIQRGMSFRDYMSQSLRDVQGIGLYGKIGYF